MKEDKTKIAVLIDADNAHSSLIEEIIAEVSKYGKATIRRIYGDWTIPQMNTWKETLNNHSLNPIQKFAYTKGKNSSDSSLIIDAMDILHDKNVDGFCIVSSDSDFTGLAKRIREEGMFVMGIGRQTTPIAFVNSCEIFTFTENLIQKDHPDDLGLAETISSIQNANTKSKAKTNKLKEVITTKYVPLSLEEIAKIDKAYEIAATEEETILVSKLGWTLRKIDPSFDPRTFGFKSLSQLFESLKKYEVVKNDAHGHHPLVKIK